MLPARALNEIDLYKFAKSIPNFRGVFMLSTLPLSPYQTECGIVNLDRSNGPGTHWVAYYKKGIQIEYFDSYGNLQPPREIINYLGKNIKYNYNRYQKNNSIICGQLCLKFLFEKYIYK
jgi:hypothetical protein